MAFYNFGYAGNAIKDLISVYHARDTGPILPKMNESGHNMGDVVKANLEQLLIAGSKVEFVWGCHMWGSNKYKVTK